MAERFEGDWLDLREPYDAAARNGALAAALSAVLPARPRILDLGAGTGSLLRWLGHWIGRAQAWVLVDADAELLERAFETVAERAEAVGWTATFPQRRVLLVHSPRGAWRVEGLVADLAEAPANLPLDRVDAVAMSALTDLVSADWVERMAAACAPRRLPFYSALNVTGRAVFAPPHPADALVARGFRRDQGRDKGFGPALGPAAPGAIAAAFGARGYQVLQGRSDWVVDRRSRVFAAALAEGHAAAALAWERRDAARIEAWAEARARHAAGGRLAVRVGHADLLCLPGGG